MKLTTLEPRWVAIGDSGKFVIGVTFNSPTTGKRLGCLFANPIDPEGWIPRIGNCMDNPGFMPDSKRWLRTGETFDTLTLSPSLDFSQHGEWHGHINAGEAH
jgi:hypothetical protein